MASSSMKNKREWRDPPVCLQTQEKARVAPVAITAEAKADSAAVKKMTVEAVAKAGQEANVAEAVTTDGLYPKADSTAVPTREPRLPERARPATARKRPRPAATA